MTAVDWAALIVSVLSIAGSFAFAVRWLVKHYLSELKPNGGSSIKDAIDRITIRQDEADIHRSKMDVKLDKMYDLLLDYVAKK
jgi:hypothetical protein